MITTANPTSRFQGQETFWRYSFLFVLLVSVAGCYADRLPKEIQHIGVARVSAIKVDSIEPVTLKPTETATFPIKLARNGNEGPIDISLSKLPKGIKATVPEQMPADKSEVEIELVGDASLGDTHAADTITVFLTMSGETLEQSFKLQLPKVSRPAFVPPAPAFMQPGDAIDFQVPIDRNGYSLPISLEPIEMVEGVTCAIPEKAIEADAVPVRVAVAENAAEGRFSAALRATVYGRELVAPLTIIISKQPFALKETPLVSLLPGANAEIELPVQRDNLESLSRLVTGGISALTGVQLVPERFNGAIDVRALRLPEGISVPDAHVHTGTENCRLQVTADEEARPGLYLIALEATADHLEAAGLLVVRVVDQTLEPGKLPTAVVDAMAKMPRLRRGGVAGRSTAQAKHLLGDFYGVTPEAEKAIQAAIGWLAEAQADDGSWQPKLMVAETGDPDSGTMETVSGVTGGQPASTALALLPFLAEGVTHEAASADTAVWLENYPETVGKALLWLGNAGSQPAPQISEALPVQNNLQDLQGYELLLIVASEVSELAGDRDLKQKAVFVAKDLVKRQLPEGGWQDDGQVTTLAAAQGLLSLHVAKSCGVNSSASAFRRAENYFTQMGSGPETAPLSQYPLTADAAIDPTATAAALLAWQYNGQAADSADQLAGAAYLAEICPEVDALSFTQPVDYLLYAGSVLRNLEGDQFDLWQSKVVSFLTRTQERDGENAGSWDPSLFAGGEDRLRTTVIATLCLQNAYRYLPLYRE
jgi:hypothetical protein